MAVRPTFLRPAILSAILAVAVGLPSPANAQQNLHFETRIRPILKAHCWHCHGEETELKGGLDARFVRTLLTGGESGPALVPGRHDSSLIWQRIQAGDMPPGEKKLSDLELQLLQQWIDAAPAAPTGTGSSRTRCCAV